MLIQQQELADLKDLVGDNWKDSIRNRSLFSCEENSDKKIKVLTTLTTCSRISIEGCVEC